MTGTPSGILHAVVLLATAGLAFRLPPRAIRLVAGTLPLLYALPLGPDESFLTGTEGLGEAVAEGFLAATLAWALVRRAWLLAALAGLFLAEELNWGQVLLGFPTPDAVRALNTRTTDLNFHNLPGLDPVWRLAPVLVVTALAHGRAPAWLSARLPRFVSPVLGPFLLAAGASLAVAGLTGARRANEAWELGVVVVAWLSLRAGERRQAPVAEPRDQLPP